MDGQKGAGLAFHTGVELEKSKTSSEHLRASSTGMEHIMGVRGLSEKSIFFLHGIQIK